VRDRRSRTLRRLLRRVVTSLVAVVVVIVAWQVLVSATEIPEYLVPTPAQVADAAIRDPGFLLSNAATTAAEILLGLAIGVVGAVVWAAVIVSSERVRRAVFPLMVAAQSAPKEALAPVFIIWWGFSLLPKVVMAALISFFPLLVATVVGLERFSERDRLLAASMGAGRLRTFFSFRLWTALPSFLAGLRLGVTLAAIGAVLGEYLGSDRGVGYLILSSSRRLDGGLLYASLIALIVMSAAFVLCVDVAEGSLLRGARSSKGPR
jgi:NitT/TauT family transport system permease protein